MSDLGNKNIFSKNLNFYMSLNKKDRYDLERDLKFPYSTITDWVNGNSYPNIGRIEILANYFNIQKSDLIEDRSNVGKCSNLTRIPVVGRVIAGIPETAIEEIIGEEYIPSSELDPNYAYFGLKIKGNSMAPMFAEGDTVIVRKQNECESGKIVVVLVNGNEATVKKIIINENSITLVPFNSAEYDPITYSKEQIENEPVEIKGIVVKLIKQID